MRRRAALTAVLGLAISAGLIESARAVPAYPDARITLEQPSGEKFKAGKLGEYTVGAAGEIVLGPPTEFTAENIDQFNF